jgi:hypothetical protein
VKHLRGRLTYANVMSSISVFLVLGGATAFAATKIGSNEIKANAIVTGKIKKEAVTEGKVKAGAIGNSRLGAAAVTAPKIAANAVTNPAIANGAVNAAKLAPGAVSAAQLAPGSIGAGQLGALNLRTETAAVANNTSGSANVVCNPGERVISGGGAWGAFGEGLSFLSSRPIKSLADVGTMANGETPTGWRSSGFNKSGAANSIQVYVICLG